MTWRRVAVIYLLLAALAVWVGVVDRRPIVESAVPGPPSVEQSLLGTAADSVREVVFRREGMEVRAVREGMRWRVVAPPEAAVAPDLIAAAVATLTAGQAAEMMRDGGGELEVFGLAAPSSAIEVTLAGEPPRRVRVLLGARNPTKTALYAKRDDRPTVYLVGLNVRYYEDLIFEAAAAARGGRAELSSRTKLAG